MSTPPNQPPCPTLYLTFGRSKLFRALAVVWMFASTQGFALDVGTTLDVMRIRYDMPVLSAAPVDHFVFRVFVQRPLSDEQYAIEGRLWAPDGHPSGTITLHQFGKQDIRIRSFTLSPAQAVEVQSWFVDSKIGPGCQPTTAVYVVDGAQLIIEGFRGGSGFRCIRNSGDSDFSRGLYRRIEAFRVWTEDWPNSQSSVSAQPEAGHMLNKSEGNMSRANRQQPDLEK